MSSTLDPRPNVIGTMRDVELLAPGPRAHADGLLAPVVRRETLTWSGGRGGRPLVVELDAENPHAETTPGVLARLGIAPFGAFLPHRTVDAFGVPALLPGARVHLVRALAPFLLPEVAPTDTLLQRMQALQSGEAAWAGNLEVRIGQRPAVERHCAMLDCLQTGRLNMAYAVVTCEPDDEVKYARSVTGDGWKVDLFHHHSFSGRGSAVPVHDGEWVRAHPTARLQIDIRPPLDAGAESALVLNVTRRSDGRTLPVEFRLQTARS